MALLLTFVAFVSLLLAQNGESACPGGSGTTSIRLVGGTQGREGRVEFCYNNQWGTVCDDYWGTLDAKVVCRQIGYSTDGAVAYRSAYFGQGSGPIWLDNVQCVGTETGINGCPKNSIGSHNCNHNEDAGVRCPPCVEGSMYLVRSGNSRQGVVFLCHAGSYGTVCDNYWDLVDAQVVCRQLGYPTTNVINTTVYGTGWGSAFGPIWADHLACHGNESRFTDCPGNFFGAVQCTHDHDAVVICPRCTQWDMQLYSAYATTPPTEGLLQVCNAQGQWRTICNHGFWCNDAKVACRQLGYNASVHTNIFYNADTIYGFFKFNRVFQYACTGSESSFSQCPQMYDSSCNNPQYKSVGLRCNKVPTDSCTPGAARLRGGADASEGRLEYCYQGQWSPFCWLQDETATVACKELGYTVYTYAALYWDERFGSSGIVSDFNKLVCSTTATESTLAECQPVQSISCTVVTCNADWSIKCFNPGICDEGTFRLVGGNIEQEGRVEVCYKGVWGTICDNGWTAIDAYIICRQLGYDGGVAPVAQVNTYYGDGVYPIVWGGLQCKGWEQNLADCPRREYLNFYCLRTDIAGVLCADDCQDGDVRLVGGDGDNDEGTVEVCYANLWGVISQAGWGLPDAQVICRQLGFDTSTTVPRYNNYYGRPKKTVHLINVACDGSEDSLSECTKTLITVNEGKSTYLNESVAGVDCVPEAPTQPSCISVTTPVGVGSPCINGAVRLQNQQDGPDNSVGRLEYCYNGEYSPVCYMDEAVASAACTSLNFVSYTYASIIVTGQYGSSSNYSLFKNITCPDSVPISGCTVNAVTDGCYPFCPGGNVAIRCFTSSGCNEGTIRLVDGFIENEGRVEVCYDGVWGSICDDGWDATDAHIACTQLGHPDLAPIPFYGSHFGDGIYPIIYSNMGCIGFENTLPSCTKDMYPQFSCPRTKTAGVLCGYDCNDGDVRLVGGSKSTEGTVEVCFDNIWGQITDAGWDSNAAQVICRLLGFSDTGSVSSVGSKYGKSNRTIMLSNVLCTGEEMALDSCSYTFHSLNEGKQLLALPNITVAGVSCLPSNCIPPPSNPGSQCTPGMLQLTSGTPYAGNLMYCSNGYWSPFCTLNAIEATVACRNLGYTAKDWAAIYDDNRYSPSINVSNFQYFNCSDMTNATSLVNCMLEDTCTSTCANPIAIRCQSAQGDSCTDGSIRLVNGSLNQEGRVEICVNNIWGSVCDSGWDKSDALVICKQLGMSVSEPYVYYGSTFGDGTGPIVYSDLMCGGWEGNIANCMKTQYPWTSCSRRNVAGLTCRDGCTNGMVMLTGGSNSTQGTVLICQDNFWSMIGDTNWDNAEARVVCRQLGFSDTGAVALTGSPFGKVNKTLNVNDFQCGGAEFNLSSCSMTVYNYTVGRIMAQTTSVAGVMCQPLPPTAPPTICPIVPTSASQTPCSNGNVMLLGGQSDRGVLMYCYNQQWSPFCTIDSKIAQVACKQLLFTQFSIASIYTKGELGTSGYNYSFFSNVSCTGLESSLQSCTFSSDGCVPTCTNNIGIRCYRSTGCQHNTIRLADGTIAQQGRVEICYNGVWSGICDDGWDNTNAYIVCKQLGFATLASAAFVDSLFGSGDGPLVYSNVACVGSETNLAQCTKSTYPDFTCSKNNAAGVMCADNCKDGDLRLVNGTSNRDGTIEICYDNLWGLVSTIGWSSKDSAVVCKQLGLYTQAPGTLSNPYKPKKTVHISNVYCTGSETRLSDCTAFKLPVNDPAQYTIVGVTCPVPNVTNITSSSLPVPTVVVTQPFSANSLYLLTGTFSVLVIVGIIAVLGLLALLFTIYQKRKHTEQILHSRLSDDDQMHLYSVVNKKRDTIVSYSSSEGGVELDNN